MRVRFRKLAKLATWPSEKISEMVSRVVPHERQQGKVAAGVCLMVGASGMATSYPAGCPVPHAVYDACAYFLHAIGCAPVFEAMARKKQQKTKGDTCKN